MKIVYTHTDEAPALATASLLPIVRAFASAAGHRDRAPRHLAGGPDPGPVPRRGSTTSSASPTRSPSSASWPRRPRPTSSSCRTSARRCPQLKAAIEELQGKGYPIPDYPDEPADDEQREIRARYDRVKGSAVNPVLRQGNSDRRAPASVKEYARQHPHSMGAWSPDSRSHVSTMSDGDFRSTERSVTVDEDGAGPDRARRS